ncbi:hypothetical protein CKY06_00555 [Photorhabdus sp. S15-56]|nr:hypothetical protein CKY15_02095 [Photorhabdus sp. S7-51]RAW76786.1 hypothetical protein CKY14_00555 [Photorhabdus sp. S14-60]RAW80766.1 hypothetical protein CKY06_00555 [Photorhabdus sp. S15-56]
MIFINIIFQFILFLQITDYRLQITDYRLQITDYRLQITDYRLQITDYRLQITDYRFNINFLRLYIKMNKMQFFTTIISLFPFPIDFSVHYWKMKHVMHSNLFQ